MQTCQSFSLLRSVAKVSAFAVIMPCLLACSPEPDDTRGTAGGSDIRPAPTTLTPTLPQPSPVDAAIATNVLTLEGLGSLKLGEPVLAGGSWSERGAQIPGSCTTISSPEFAGVYAIVEEGKVQRISIGSQSNVRLREGVGAGTPERELRAAFPGLIEEPHKYVESPAKYLTAPDAAPGKPALRFEIGRDGKVSLMHVGLMPVLAYVEGCA